jgi:endonuclease/exonuclease/phosphatase family metal-dependent hydrolase
MLIMAHDRRILGNSISNEVRYNRSMRVASYNIMSGGFNSYSTTASEPERIAILQNAVSDLKADVIGLIDTFRWDELYTASDLTTLFGYKYAYCINLNDERLKKLGHNNGITLLSNLGIIKSQTITLATRDAVIAQLQDGSKIVNIAVVYLDDLSEDARLEQLKELRNYIDPQEPWLIIGDLNSIKKSDRDSITTPLRQFQEENPEIAKKLSPAIHDMMRGEVIEQLESWGLQDADKENHATLPTPLFPGTIYQPFLRLDYCFHSPSLSTSHFNSPRSDVYTKASDHFPIVFDVK